MRRPLLLFLFAISSVIIVLHYLDPFGLGSLILPRSSLDISGEVQYIEGIVTKAVPKDGYCAITLKCGSESVLVRLRGDYSVTDIYDLVGRTATAGGYLQQPDERRNPGTFDYRLYLKGRRIFTIMDVSRFRFSAGKIVHPLLHFLSLKKGEFLDAARKYMSDQEFSITSGLMFGETSFMDENLYEQFRLNGIAHVLAVSGLHVGLLYAIILRLFRNRKGWKTSIAVLILLFIYAALSSFSVSVLRASFMIALHILAPHLKRRYDMVNAATLCAIVFLLVNPYQLFDIGFQLSFAAAYSMGIALPWAVSKGTELSDRYKKKWILSLFEIFAPGFMVQLGMTPLILFHFLTFSPIALLINPLAVLLAGMLLPAGLVCFCVSLFFRGIPLIMACGPAGGFSFFLKLLSSAGGYIGGSFYTCAPPFTTLVLYYVLFFWFFSETRVVLNRRNSQLQLLVIDIALAACSCVAPFILGLSESIIPWNYNHHAATFVDVGQGDCIHFNIDGYNILVDGGGYSYGNIAERTLRPYLLKNGIDHIDLAIVTHQDNDHSLGIRQLAEIYPINKVMKIGSDNDDCGICLVRTGSVTTLLMADADIEREKLLLASHCNDVQCDIIKIGHHGSAGSTGAELLQAAKPSFAVISCGKNNIYGHPSDRVIELLEKSGIIYARTDRDGAVFLKYEKDGLLVFENAAGTKQWLIQKNR